MCYEARIMTVLVIPAVALATINKIIHSRDGGRLVYFETSLFVFALQSVGRRHEMC